MPIADIVQDSLDLLRGQLVRHKHGRPLTQIADAIGLEANILARFLRGEQIKMDRLALIERWCAIQEQAERDARSQGAAWPTLP